MCNLYIMYYMEVKYVVFFMICIQNVVLDMFRIILLEVNILIFMKFDMVMMYEYYKEIEYKDKIFLLQQLK